MTVSDPANATRTATPPLGHGSGPPRAAGKPAAPPVTFVDWLMLLLAIVSVGLLVWITFWDVGADDRAPGRGRRLRSSAGSSRVEFVARWRRSRMGWRFLRTYWYEILGMIPLSHPAFRSFRLLRIVVILRRASPGRPTARSATARRRTSSAASPTPSST